MPTFPGEDVQAVRQRLKDGMTSYMQATRDGDETWPGYSQGDIDRCLAIVDGYLAAVPPGSNLPQAKIRGAVQKAVLALNALNEEAGCALIETDQREDLCRLILVAATRAGLDTDEDITEEWREW